MMESSNCFICGFPDCDVRIVHGGGDTDDEAACCLHARCVPHGVIVRKVNGSTTPVKANEMACICCRKPIAGLYLAPMSLADLDQAVELRRETGVKTRNENGKRPSGASKSEDEAHFFAIQAEASYLLLSHSSLGGSSSLADFSDYQRTGRWTEQETALVDCLIDAFNKGQFPLPEGMRLNDFLRDLLLCKSSRLTKKMKHAKLSSRCYELKNLEDYKPRDLSILEDEFLKSVSQLPNRLELRFNFIKVWRTSFSNLCVQSGSQLLIADDWIASLEIMEKKSIEAEEIIRAARRYRMGLALKADIRNNQEGVFFAGQPVQLQGSVLKKQKSEKYSDPDTTISGCQPSSYPSVVDVRLRSSDSVVCSDDDEAEFISTMLDLGADSAPGFRLRSTSLDDFSEVFDELPDSIELSAEGHVQKYCGPFLEAAISMVEKHNLPFQHVDVWVPSELSSALSEYGYGNENDSLRLYHGGYATRRDLDRSLTRQLDEYGEYSTKFSFSVGAGLPGRVYESGLYSWESSLDEADSNVFKRAGGAKVYGIKTGLGIALSMNVIGRMVVALYSMDDIVEDELIIQTCVQELETLSPKPKWTLVVDTNQRNHIPPDTSFPTTNLCDSKHQSVTSFSKCVNLDHYRHSIVSSTSTEQKLAPQITQSSAFPPRYRSPSVDGTVESQQSRSSQIEVLGASNEAHSIDCHIAMILGGQIPFSDGQNLGGVKGAPIPSIADYMSLRLMLLRSLERRSDLENEMIEIIRKSYEGYTKDPRRTVKQIACLLVVDWIYLNGINTHTRMLPALSARSDQDIKSLPFSDDQISSSSQIHHVDAGLISMTSDGTLTGKPPTFCGTGRIHRGSSFDLVLTRGGAHPSSFDQSISDSAQSISIVDDNSEGNS